MLLHPLRRIFPKCGNELRPKQVPPSPGCVLSTFSLIFLDLPYDSRTEHVAKFQLELLVRPMPALPQDGSPQLGVHENKYVGWADASCLRWNSCKWVQREGTSLYLHTHVYRRRDILVRSRRATNGSNPPAGCLPCRIVYHLSRKNVVYTFTPGQPHPLHPTNTMRPNGQWREADLDKP